MNPLELNMEVQEVATDYSRCYTCKETIFGKMFQYFVFNGLEPTETKFKLCEKCYHEGINEG